MSVTSHPLWGTLNTIISVPRTDGLAKIIALVSPFTGSGTSYVARDLALLAAKHYVPQGGRVALMDLDINQQTQCAGFDKPKSIGEQGAIQGPFDATFGQVPFWQVSPDMVEDSGQRTHAGNHCGLFFVGETGLAVSAFDWETVKDGQTVHIRRVPDYWHAARSQFSFIIIDCPATDRASIAMDIIPDADASIIITPSFRSTDPEHNALAQKIVSAGGACAGIVQNEGLAIQEYAGAIR